jgi:hypothetical protein
VTGGTSNLVFTGAIGDYGKSLDVDQSGKTDPKGSYSKIMLQKGTFRANLTALKARLNKATFPIDKAGCSSGGSVTASVSVCNGTGLYKGISGKVNITLTYVWIVARGSSGKCTGEKVLFQSSYLTGAGAVSFS